MFYLNEQNLVSISHKLVSIGKKIYCIMVTGVRDEPARESSNTYELEGFTLINRENAIKRIS